MKLSLELNRALGRLWSIAADRHHTITGWFIRATSPTQLVLQTGDGNQDAYESQRDGLSPDPRNYDLTDVAAGTEDELLSFVRGMIYALDSVRDGSIGYVKGDELLDL